MTEKVLSADGTTKLLRKVIEDVAGVQFAPVFNSRSMKGGNLAVIIAGAAVPVLLASKACTQVTIFNNTGTTIEVQQDAAGVYFPIATGTPWTFQGISNANQLGVRRTDQSAVSVTAPLRWEL